MENPHPPAINTQAVTVSPILQQNGRFQCDTDGLDVSASQPYSALFVSAVYVSVQHFSLRDISSPFATSITHY